MSLALLQGYSSAEEVEDDQFQYLDSSDDAAASDGHASAVDVSGSVKSSIDFPKPSAGSLLPSAFDAFSEITRPPEFLNNCVEDQAPVRESDQQRGGRHGGRRNRKGKKDVPAGAVVEAKPQLVGIHERVRSDIEGNIAPTSSVQPQKGSLSTVQVGGKRVATATNPNPEDAAELLRMCLLCGIPKTYSSARGMVCPVCGDRPPVDSTREPEKKKGSAIKEKEKSKRMKGQSSHATWKSETEMQLRQQFD